jgi:hypothetical protein
MAILVPFVLLVFRYPSYAQRFFSMPRRESMGAAGLLGGASG